MGRANETEVEIDGKIIKALIDSAAMISMISKGYCDVHGYKIQSLDWLVPIEGSVGRDVPYLGYVEVRMRIPGISSFDQDVLMLIRHTTTHCHRRVPIKVGSHIIDQVTNSITEKVVVLAFQTVIMEGLTKVTGHQKHVHMLVKPAPKCTSVFVPGNTSELTPGGSGVAVVLRNLSGRDVSLEPHTEVGIVTSANIVPINTDT